MFNVLEPHATDLSVYLPADHRTSTESRNAHIFYITGNPGCIAYYHDFLALLSQQLAALDVKSHVSVCGFSLPNFVDGTSPVGPEVYSLQQIISWSRDRLEDYARAQLAGAGQQGPIEIILMGHSVGAYIGLEIIRQLQSARVTRESGAANVDVIGYVGLWPTVTDIYKSKNGVLAARIFCLPLIGTFFMWLAEALARLIPYQLLLGLVKLFTGFPDASAEVTCKFLKSKRGVRQALVMGRQEIEQIREDRWTDEVWGSATSPKTPRLAFHFGAEDQWVNNATRDKLISARAQTNARDSWKPIMEVDTHGIPHAFSIRHSKKSAEIASRLVQSIISGEGATA